MYIDVDLVTLCLEIHHGRRDVGPFEKSLLEAAVKELRRGHAQHAEDTAPPQDMVQDLRQVGWLIYVMSWAVLQTVPTDWSRITGEKGDRAREQMQLLEQLAQAARSLPWPEWAPRALGAFRTHALGISKSDTVLGYSAAWSIHTQADAMYSGFRITVKQDKKLTRDLDEIQVQLKLAETGTSCREPEQIVTDWDLDASAAEDEFDAEASFITMFQRLETGTTRGLEAIALARRLDEEDRFGDEVDEFHLLTRSNYRNPGIMAARAHLIMLPMTPVMEAWKQPNLDGHVTWASTRQHLLDNAVSAYRTIEAELEEKFRDDHLRQVVQLRLMLAFVGGGLDLRSAIPEISHFRSVLDLDAVPELSEWLTAGGHDANIIGSAMMPAYLAGLHAIMGDERWQNYLDWRRTHPQLDRHGRDETARTARAAVFEQVVQQSTRII